LGDAARAYANDRYADALRALRKLASEAPGSPAVKELLGLTLYRLGKWPLAARELEAYHKLCGSYDQFPVLADCYRAMRRYPESEAVWSELRKASPSAEVMVAAARRGVRKADLAHLRQWYALADLYERAGEIPRARDLFKRIASEDPEAYDVRHRLGALR
jgi:tetratricopeptide (TPR) repeat protein